VINRIADIRHTRAYPATHSKFVKLTVPFEGMAREIEAEIRAIKLAKERITLCRRDIAKMIATGIEEGVPTCRAGPRKLGGASLSLSGAGRGRFADSEEGRAGVRGGRSVCVG
jgi:hypothetical protein